MFTYRSTYSISCTGIYELPESKSKVLGWFINNLTVLGPFSLSALTFIEWTLTGWVNEIAIMSWKKQ